MKNKAFTLVEMMSVMAIIAVLAVLSVPAVSSLTSAGTMNQAVSGISLTLDQARAYAMAHNTYVWVGFGAETASQQLAIGVLAGTTGEADDLGTPGNCALVSRIETYNHLGLDATIEPFGAMSTSEDDISNSNLSAGAFQQSLPGTSTPFTYVLQFSPNGEATIDKSTGSSHFIQIGLQLLRGANADKTNVAAVQVATLTGQVQVFRP